MQTVLNEVARQAGRQSGLVQRRSKLDGAGLAQTLVFGFLANPQATWEELAQTAGTLGIAITPQGLDERLGPRAAECLRQVLAAAIETVLAAKPLALPIWQRFQGVYVQDSSTLSLPAALADVWAGCGGGAAPGDGAAALKVQVQWELVSGQLSALQLQPGRAQDRSAGALLLGLPPGALCLTDLGYFSLERLQTQAQAGVYWLTRLQAGKRLEIDGQVGSLADWLPAQPGPTVERWVQVGVQHQLPCRLLAVRVPPAVAAERRRKLRAAARDKGQAVSAERLALADWEVLITNVPVEQLSLAEAWQLARVRWQIELLFKLWKSHGQVDEWRSAKPWRILCEVYAKLIGQIVQHWLILVSCWSVPDRSLVKAAQTIRKQALHLASRFRDPHGLADVLAVVQRCLQHGCRLNKRRAAPSTYQVLAAILPQPALA
jgi:hypothetical protein